MSNTQQTETKRPVKEIISMLGQYNLLSQLQREIIIDEAISSIECTLQEQESAYQKLMELNQVTNQNCSSDAPAQAQKQLLEALTRKLKIEKFKRATWEKELPGYFIGRKSKLDKVVYSKIINQDRGIAQEIYFRLVEEEESFAELARQYSQEPRANVNAIVGPIKICSLNPQLAQLLLNSKPGQISPPICCHNAFMIVRLEQIISAVLDESMRCQLYHELFESWLAQQCSKMHYQNLMWQKLSSLTA